MKRETLRDRIAAYEADPDPLNTLPEIAATRALFEDYVNRYDEITEALLAWYRSNGQEPKPGQILDISEAYRLLSEITKMVKRVQDARAANAVSIEQLNRIMSDMARGVERYVEDPDTLEKIKDYWLTIRL